MTVEYMPTTQAVNKATINEEEIEDVDESEVDGEERPHEHINIIPNSQVARNKEELTSLGIGSAITAGVAMDPQSGDKDVASSTSHNNHQEIANVQEYTMKSMTLNYINANDSSTIDNAYQINKSHSNISSGQGGAPIGLYYNNGAVIKLIPTLQNSTQIG